MSSAIVAFMFHDKIYVNRIELKIIGFLEAKDFIFTENKFLLRLISFILIKYKIVIKEKKYPIFIHLPQSLAITWKIIIGINVIKYKRKNNFLYLKYLIFLFSK